MANSAATPPMSMTPAPMGDAAGLEKLSEMSARTHGSGMNSLTSTFNTDAGDGEMLSAPTIVDIKRLAKIKAEQEQRLKTLRVRVDRLAAQERRVWKDVTWTQHMSLQAQETQLRREAQQAERMRVERERAAHEQELRERAHQARLRTLAHKDVPRLRKFEENTAAGNRVREDSRRISQEVLEAHQVSVQRKASQAERLRQQRRQQRLRKELELTRSEQLRQDANLLKFAELQENLRNIDLALSSAEQDEMSAVQRLQNSQSVRAELVSHLQDERVETPFYSEVDGSPAVVAPAVSAGSLWPDSHGGKLAARGERRSSPRCRGRSPSSATSPRLLRGGLSESRASSLTSSGPLTQIAEVRQEEDHHIRPSADDRMLRAPAATTHHKALSAMPGPCSGSKPSRISRPLSSRTPRQGSAARTISPACPSDSSLTSQGCPWRNGGISASGVAPCTVAPS
mmetsp:Transcript_81958/g.228432  ORF Transcript_81958/g.228432 Transcript_81958/m.228432 type:complete len:456 (-) Transcript_81958:92-1459(-)|eukprot:CAMPEP_0117480678 /NCGR_PEP_ID=MMETSP0784-20121206/12512_1 /TAXON_ID=39447 /ORGANISM="" /LENGTH=455 /DNA_ID=CAMNT_0005275119 /DNA_START=60 /DNA_END=1427 /DNA_ORIENTATION=+